MPSPKDHPFTVHFRPCQGVPGHYVWTIRRRRAPCCASVQAYPSFEAARLAAQEALRGVLAAWRSGATQSPGPA